MDNTKELAQRIYNYTDPWERENTVEEIEETIRNNPQTVIGYLMDIIEDMTGATLYDDTGNAPCDNCGYCIGSSCYNYPRCQGWTK